MCGPRFTLQPQAFADSGLARRLDTNLRLLQKIPEFSAARTARKRFLAKGSVSRTRAYPLRRSLATRKGQTGQLLAPNGDVGVYVISGGTASIVAGCTW